MRLNSTFYDIILRKTIRWLEFMFVDEVQIQVISGHGGAGCVSYRREKYLPKGGPDGGDGGRGGGVILKTNPHLKSLLHLTRKRQYRAENGQPGQGQKKTGKNGKDLIIQVPVGTLLKDENGHVLYDLYFHRSPICLLKGGLGGKGNHFFRNSRDQAPSFAQTGQKGQEKSIHLELKLIADLSLIGFPNAGKSTLLSCISSANPKIADYPFTTLKPHLGVLQPIQGQDPLTVADIPGLVVNAHKGIGLGQNFLKYIERTKVLVYVLDALSEREPINDYYALRREISYYQKDQKILSLKDQTNKVLPKLSQRPSIVAINKIDAISSWQLKSIISKFTENNISVIPISAEDGLGLRSFLYHIQNLVSKTTKQMTQYTHNIREMQ